MVFYWLIDPNTVRIFCIAFFPMDLLVMSDSGFTFKCNVYFKDWNTLKGHDPSFGWIMSFLLYQNFFSHSFMKHSAASFEDSEREDLAVIACGGRGLNLNIWLAMTSQHRTKTMKPWKEKLNRRENHLNH